MWTQADLDALKAAIVKGVRRVRYSDREVEYQSLEDMLALMGEMERDLQTAAGTSYSYRLASTSKGL